MEGGHNRMAQRNDSEKGVLDRLLGLAAEVRPGEATTALLLSSAGFLTLASYYTIRPLRSAFLLPVNVTLPGGGVLDGPVITSYSGAVLALIFLFVVPAYGALASRVNRMRLINVVTLFFAANLVIFSLFGAACPRRARHRVLPVGGHLQPDGAGAVLVVRQRSVSQEQGKRLFAIVGFGATLGGIAGRGSHRRSSTRSAGFRSCSSRPSSSDCSWPSSTSSTLARAGVNPKKGRRPRRRSARRADSSWC